MANKKRVQISFTAEQYALLEKLAKEKGFSKSAIVVLAIEQFDALNKDGKERK